MEKKKEDKIGSVATFQVHLELQLLPTKLQHQNMLYFQTMHS